MSRNSENKHAVEGAKINLFKNYCNRKKILKEKTFDFYSLNQRVNVVVVSLKIELFLDFFLNVAPLHHDLLH